MEPDLEQRPDQNRDLINVASYFARDAHALCSDVSAMAFPTGHALPSEQMLSAVSTKLYEIVKAIEKYILSDADEEKTGAPVTWKILTQSQFLKERGLIDFALARFAEERLIERISSNSDVAVSSQLTATLLKDGDAAIAEAAQALLASDTVIRGAPNMLYRELPPALLHQLCWRVVAALQIIQNTKNPEHIARAKRLLSGHDEAQCGRVAARKIVHFLAPEHYSNLQNPSKAGLSLFAAYLAAKTGLEHDHILRLIDGPNSGPLAMMLSACDFPREDAMEIIRIFKVFDLTPYEITNFEKYYGVMDAQHVLAELDRWREERTRYLEFPDFAPGDAPDSAK